MFFFCFFVFSFYFVLSLVWYSIRVYVLMIFCFGVWGMQSVFSKIQKIWQFHELARKVMFTLLGHFICCFSFSSSFLFVFLVEFGPRVVFRGGNNDV